MGELWKEKKKLPTQRNLRTTKSGKQEISLQKWGLKPDRRRTKVWHTCDIIELCSVRWGCKTGKCHVRLSLFVRHTDQDGAEPSANSVSASNLLRLSHYTGKREWLQKSQRLLAAFTERLTKVPIALPEMVRALMAQHYTLKQVIHLLPYFIASRCLSRQLLTDLPNLLGASGIVEPPSFCAEVSLAWGASMITWLLA